ncbi:MAG: class I SAM-dependent methyltransferase [Candidatus Pacebacteria bacterium]|nr:class I SAM-dependent methyltransferase [Candidatus Paceibacterota bacterium]
MPKTGPAGFYVLGFVCNLLFGAWNLFTHTHLHKIRYDSSMSQQHIWEREYRDQKLMTNKAEPQQDTKKFFKWVRTQYPHACAPGAFLVDIGCGTGRNTHFAQSVYDMRAHGFDIARNAIDLARARAFAEGLDIQYRVHSMAEPFPYPDACCDIALDVTSSNSLYADERAVYMHELCRILKPGGVLFVKGLCLDGDTNAKQLLKKFPASEPGMYTMPETSITEKVWRLDEFRAYYEPFFDIHILEKKTNYSKMNNRSYKRNFLIAYMTKK